MIPAAPNPGIRPGLCFSQHGAGKRRNQQGGYALLMVMFALALLVIATATLAPRVVTDVQREKEAELVWRGKQYTRGIRLYYMKTHHFPTNLEDLASTKNRIRFMRRAYKDPMNPVDGSWRLIYVGPNGQLIGSLRPQTLRWRARRLPTRFNFWYLVGLEFQFFLAIFFFRGQLQ
jgi:hypothetical protein